MKKIEATISGKLGCATESLILVSLRLESFHQQKGSSWSKALAATSNDFLITLPKTNIAAENRPSQKEIWPSNHPFSGAMLVSGRVTSSPPSNIFQLQIPPGHVYPQSLWSRCRLPLAQRNLYLPDTKQKATLKSIWCRSSKVAIPVADSTLEKKILYHVFWSLSQSFYAASFFGDLHPLLKLEVQPWTAAKYR